MITKVNTIWRRNYHIGRTFHIWTQKYGSRHVQVKNVSFTFASCNLLPLDFFFIYEFDILLAGVD